MVDVSFLLAPDLALAGWRVVYHPLVGYEFVNADGTRLPITEKYDWLDYLARHWSGLRVYNSQSVYIWKRQDAEDKAGQLSLWGELSA